MVGYDPDMHLSLGIDEAGRGPVLGPLVVACVVANPSDRRWFTTLRVRDSKIVPSHEREALAARIKERCFYRLLVAEPAQIDTAIRDRARTLNGLEREMMSDLLKEAQAAFPDEDLRAYIDTPDINAERFGDALHETSGWKDRATLFALHRADAKHRTVGAASLIAKEERERLMRELRQEIGVDLGCGYPHDERTREFLKTCTRESPHVRWTWKTAEICTSAKI